VNHQQLFLDLLKLALARVDVEDGFPFLEELRADRRASTRPRASRIVGATRARLEWLPPRAKMRLWLSLGLIPKTSAWRRQLRLVGRDLPNDADTMVGLARLQNIEDLALDVFARQIPGDFVEAGVWRGGSAMLMRALQCLAGEENRRVWLADSFQGLPLPDEADIADKGSAFHRVTELAVSRADVESRFQRYGLLDENVRFIEGWFSESLPGADTGPIALLRVDADMYRSTLDALNHLHHRVVSGGYVIVDDYGAIPECRMAVDEFRSNTNVTSPIMPIDFTGVFWQLP